MRYTHFIKQIDHKPDRERLASITGWLQQRGVAYRIQPYATGANLVVDLGEAHKRMAIGSHFDIVEDSGGANDNGSAIAVCLNIIERFIQNPPHHTGIRVFFFDEEENGLKGSAAYTRQYGVADLTGLLNLELVGVGDKFAVWPVNAKSTGPLLEAFEQSAQKAGIGATRFDNIITNTADHLSFRKAGLADAFTITCITDKDLQAAAAYYAAMRQGIGADKLRTILSQAPVFTHYHQPTDTWDKLDEKAIERTAATIWDTISAP